MESIDLNLYLSYNSLETFLLLKYLFALTTTSDCGEIEYKRYRLGCWEASLENARIKLKTLLSCSLRDKIKVVPWQQPRGHETFLNSLETNTMSEYRLARIEKIDNYQA